MIAALSHEKGIVFGGATKKRAKLTVLRADTNDVSVRKIIKSARENYNTRENVCTGQRCTFAVIKHCYGIETRGTLAWLLERYRDTSAWRDLSMATRRQRENIFKGIIEKAGGAPYRAVSRKSVTEGRDRRSATPAQARNFLDAMRGLFRWALGADMVKVDPTAGVSNPKRTKSAWQVGAWFAQGRRYTGGKQWGNRCAA